MEVIEFERYHVVNNKTVLLGHKTGYIALGIVIPFGDSLGDALKVTSKPVYATTKGDRPDLKRFLVIDRVDYEMYCTMTWRLQRMSDFLSRIFDNSIPYKYPSDEYQIAFIRHQFRDRKDILELCGLSN